MDGDGGICGMEVNGEVTGRGGIWGEDHYGKEGWEHQIYQPRP